MGVVDILHTLYVIIVNYIIAFFELFVPPKRKSIKGEIVLITGGGHGIGREIALEMSKLETTVVIWDINKETCEKTVAEIKKSGGKAYAYKCDVRSSSQIKDVASKVREDVGEISILINNAGILNGNHLMDLDEAAIHRTFEVNTLAHFWMIREFLPNMMTKNHGHILNICSMASFVGVSCMTDYCSSKFAAFGFSSSLIAELSDLGMTGIRVSSVCPMFVDTGLVTNIKENKVSRLLQPKEVALAAIDGMLRNYEVITVPTYMWVINRIGSFFPIRTIKFMMEKTGQRITPQPKKEN